MRKYIILFASLLVAAVSYGQNTINTVDNHKDDVNAVLDLKAGIISAPLTYWDLYGSAADTVSSADSTWTYSFGVNHVLDAYKIAGRIKLDSISGTPTTTVTLEGKHFYDDAWTVLATETWAGTTSDTTLNFDYTTAKAYRFIRFHHDCTATTAQKYKINEQEIQLYK